MVGFLETNAPPGLALGGEFGCCAVEIETAWAHCIAVAGFQLGACPTLFCGDLDGEILTAASAAYGAKLEVRRARCLELNHARRGLACRRVNRDHHVLVLRSAQGCCPSGWQEEKGGQRTATGNYFPHDSIPFAHLKHAFNRSSPPNASNKGFAEASIRSRLIKAWALSRVLAKTTVTARLTP